MQGASGQEADGAALSIGDALDAGLIEGAAESIVDGETIGVRLGDAVDAGLVQAATAAPTDKTSTRVVRMRRVIDGTSGFGDAGAGP